MKFNLKLINFHWILLDLLCRPPCSYNNAHSSMSNRGSTNTSRLHNMASSRRSLQTPRTTLTFRGRLPRRPSAYQQSKHQRHHHHNHSNNNNNNAPLLLCTWTAVACAVHWMCCEGREQRQWPWPAVRISSMPINMQRARSLRRWTSGGIWNSKCIEGHQPPQSHNSKREKKDNKSSNLERSNKNKMNWKLSTLTFHPLSMKSFA